MTVNIRVKSAGLFGKVVFIGFLILSSLNAVGWGKTGHRAVAEIAYGELNKTTKKNIEKILGDSYLPLFATYADDIRSELENPNGSLPHYVNMNFDESYETAPESGQADLVAVFNDMVSKLNNPESTKEDQAVALKFIIHLVADAHQPMHVGLAEDLGGNKVEVTWFGERTNLHYLWDENMIDYSRLSYIELARFAGEPATGELKKMYQSTVVDWINESHEYTKIIYDNLGDKDYGYAYYYEFSPIFLTQIQKAGFRLGHLLNELMK